MGTSKDLLGIMKCPLVKEYLDKRKGNATIKEILLEVCHLCKEEEKCDYSVVFVLLKKRKKKLF
jgi:hypothetical protein